MSDYVGRPVRAIRFNGSNLDELAALLPGSRNEVVRIHREGDAFDTAASIWTLHDRVTVPMGSWLVVADPETYWCMNHMEFSRTYERPDGEGS